MKTADLKVGELYAVRHVYEPCLLLSTAVYERRSGRMGAEKWALAKPGTKPHRDQSKFFGQGRVDSGFVVLAGPVAKLGCVRSEADAQSILDFLVAHGDADAVAPKGASIQMVFSSVAFTGEYETVQAEAEARKAAETARKQKRVDEYNTLIDGLNTVLGDKPLRRAEVEWGEPPMKVELSLEQARALIAAVFVAETQLSQVRVEESAR